MLAFVTSFFSIFPMSFLWVVLGSLLGSFLGSTDIPPIPTFCDIPIPTFDLTNILAIIAFPLVFKGSGDTPIPTFVTIPIPTFTVIPIPTFPQRFLGSLLGSFLGSPRDDAIACRGASIPVNGPPQNDAEIIVILNPFRSWNPPFGALRDHILGAGSCLFDIGTSPAPEKDSPALTCA